MGRCAKLAYYGVASVAIRPRVWLAEGRKMTMRPTILLLSGPQRKGYDPNHHPAAALWRVHEVLDEE
jgi:hypothetical protein